MGFQDVAKTVMFIPSSEAAARLQFWTYPLVGS
jgi:hypothetical protein